MGLKINQNNAGFNCFPFPLSLPFFPLSKALSMCRFFLPALVLIELLFVGLYVGHEQMLYFWDYAMYHNMAVQWFNAPSPWALFSTSFSQDYNLLFAAPAWIGFALFGTSRLVFILSMFLSWFLAYQVAVAFLLARLFQLKPEKAALFSLITCLFQPPLWVPLFEGYPDYGAAAALTIALFLLLPQTKQTARSFLLAGFLLGFAVAFRRHFAYPAFALLLTAGFFALGAWHHASSKSFPALMRALSRPFFAGLALCLTVFVIEPSYVLHALTTDFSSLYQSYTTGFSTIVWYVLVWNGLGWVALVATGLILAGRLLPIARPALAFVSLYTGLWLLVWGMGPAQASLHYLLHAPYLFGSVAFTGLLITSERAQAYRFVRIGALLFLTVSMLWCLALAPETTPSNAAGRYPSLFAAPRPPMRRTDLAQLKSLGQWLADTTQPSDRLVAVGSSFLWNQDILRAVFTDQLDRRDMVARQIWAPEIDGEQAPPFIPLAMGSVFIVPDRPQFHLDPSGQRVVAALASFFAQKPAAPFEKDDAVFTLEDGTRLSIWRRKGDWKPSSLKQAFAGIFDQAGGQAPTLVPTDRHSLLLLTPLPQGNYQLSIDLPRAGTCDRLTGAYAFITDSEQSTGDKTFGPPLTTVGLFMVPMRQPFASPAYLSLSFHAQALLACPIPFDHLQLRSF